MSPSEWAALCAENKQLTGKDFAAAGVVRPVTKTDIRLVCPQAELDKTVADETPPDKRCEFCFGPIPCKDHGGVLPLNIVTSRDVDPIGVIAGAYNAGLEEVVIVGRTKDGREYFASSIADAAPAVYYLQRGIHRLNKIIDEGQDEDGNVRPDPAA